MIQLGDVVPTPIHPEHVPSETQITKVVILIYYIWSSLKAFFFRERAYLSDLWFGRLIQGCTGAKFLETPDFFLVSLVLSNKFTLG